MISGLVSFNFGLDLSHPEATAALPPWLAAAAENLNRVIPQSGSLVDDAVLANSMPPDLRLLEVFRAEGEAQQATLPGYRKEVSVLVEAYVRSRYGAKELSFADRRRMADAWLRVRLPLLLRFFRRRTV